MEIIRHGDLIIRKANIPSEAKQMDNNTLAEGEYTGHSHALLTKEREPINVMQHNGVIYFSVKETAVVTHQEHKEITIPVGDYVVTREREFDPFLKRVREVRD